MHWAALLSLAAVGTPSFALAQEEEEEEEAPAPEWPDPGSEEPGGPKLFSKDTESEEAPDVRVAIPAKIGEPTYRWSWYGWRNLIGDGAAILLVVVSAITQRLEVFAAGGVAYAIGGPIAHFTAGNWGRALISFGMRIGGPLLVGLAFAAVKCTADECSDDDGTFIAIGLGAFVGAVVAAGLDVGLVAREQVPVEPKIAIAPSFGATREGTQTFGVSLKF
jgi:hypothetical protein